MKWEFEYPVGFGLLNEVPRTTDVDFFVSGPRGVLALESKFMEGGMGSCSCFGRAEGRCEKRVLARPYWKVAQEIFTLPAPQPAKPCALSLSYQLVRNTAAVLEMSGLRERAAFGVMYDERNPYFSGAGTWPGWARVINNLTNDIVTLRAVSWQDIIRVLTRRGRSEVFKWAEEKHGLVAHPTSASA